MDKDIAKLTIEDALPFLRSIKADEKVLVAHGHDNDTICSAIIMQRIVGHFTEASAELFPLKDNFAVSDEDVAAMKKLDYDRLIIVDIAHVATEKAMKLIDHKDTLFIDHHQPIKFKNAVYCNPRLFDKHIYMPVSYLTYRLYESFGEASRVAWIAAVGVLSDHGMAVSKDLFDFVYKLDPKLLGEKCADEEELFTHSTLGKLAKVLDNARVVKGREGAVFAANTLQILKSYKSLINGGTDDTARLKEWSGMAEKEFRRLVTDFNRKRKLLKGNVIFYEIPSKMNIKSSLGGYLVQFCPENVLVLAQQKDRMMDVSLRRGKRDGTDLNKMAQRAVKGIPGGAGGGHEAASGARLPMKYLPKFLKQL